nr:retrovirus-related Pol polyprotein from transposon TNT 1-94 [Tanacetum cinerariifolium]
MHNNIMAAGSRDRPPMLATGRYVQWQSCFLRYIDTRTNGDAMRKCILEGPYTLYTVIIPAVPVTDDSPEVPKRITVETILNKSFEIKEHYQSEKEAIHFLLTRIGNEIYSTVDACKTAHDIWIAIERLQQEQAYIDKDMQKNLALIAKYFKKIYQPTNNNLKTFSNFRNKNVDTSPRYKNDNQTGQFRNHRTVTVVGARESVGSQVMQQNRIQCFNCKKFGHFAKECRKPKRVKDNTYHKKKMLLCKQAEKGVPLQAKHADWLEDTDKEIDEQKLEAHYSYMAKIQEHSEQPESINNTCVVEKVDSNVIPDSLDMCDNDIQTDQNAKECLVLQRQKASDYDNSGLAPQLQNVSPSADTTALSQQELDLLFGPLYDEFFIAGTSSVNKSSSHTDNSKQQDTPPTMNIQSLIEPTTLKMLMLRKTTIIKQHIHSSDMMNLSILSVHRYKKLLSLPHAMLIIQICIPSINHTILNTDGTKDHPLEQVHRNPSKPEAMADSTWIEAMPEELHQFERLQVWELVDKPFSKTVIKLKWLWKNIKEEDQTVIQNKARLIAKGYAQEEGTDFEESFALRLLGTGSESRPPMLNKENYVPWSSRLLRYAKSNGERDVNVNETFHEQTDDELSERELKQIEADDQAIQTILLGLPEDIYAAVDSCETAQEIWLRVQQMMKGSDIGIQEKKAKLFNEWEMFTSNERESIESYYHCFLKLM